MISLSLLQIDSQLISQPFLDLSKLSPFKVAQSFISIYSTVIFIRLLLTWFPAVDIFRQVESFLSPVTDPYLNIFRNIIPPVGNMDVSPMLAMLVLIVIAPYVLSTVESLLRMH
jgi:YggT family protein